jgi:hypothetical protein
MHLGRTMYGKEGHVCSGGRYFKAMPGIRGYRTFKYRMAINTVGVQAVHRCIGRSLSKRSQALQRLLIPAVTKLVAFRMRFTATAVLFVFATLCTFVPHVRAAPTLPGPPNGGCQTIMGSCVRCSTRFNEV